MQYEIQHNFTFRGSEESKNIKQMNHGLNSITERTLIFKTTDFVYM